MFFNDSQWGRLLFISVQQLFYLQQLFAICFLVADWLQLLPVTGELALLTMNLLTIKHAGGLSSRSIILTAGLQSFSRGSKIENTSVTAMEYSLVFPVLSMSHP